MLIYFIYSKIVTVLTIDPWGTPQFMVPCFWKHMVQWNEGSSVCEVRMKSFYCFIQKSRCTSFCPIKFLWSKVLKSIRRSIKIITVCFPFSALFKILSEDNSVFNCKVIFYHFWYQRFFYDLRYYFCYLTFRRKRIKLYREVCNVSEMSSYYWSTIFKKSDRDLTYSRSLDNI